jgi:hypothetical protein
MAALDVDRVLNHAGMALPKAIVPVSVPVKSATREVIAG